MSPDDDAGRTSAGSPGENRPTADLPEDPDDLPGVPGFRSWGAVYVFVFGAFVALVIALAIFSRVYA